MRFEWDDKKKSRNLDKHSVSFEEARTVFFDDWAVEYYDPDHSKDEDRFLMVGRSVKSRMLVVSYHVKDGGATIRLISARRATKRERSTHGGPAT